MIYLASPYSHPDPDIREARFHAACRAMAMLLPRGEKVFSPVVHSHPLVAHGLPTDWEFWQAIDSEFLLYCDELAVLTLEGWEESRGVQAEIALAIHLGKPVRLIAPDSASSGDRSCCLGWVADGEERT